MAMAIQNKTWFDFDLARGRTLLLVVAATLLLAGCGGNDSAEPTPQPAAATPAGADPAVATLPSEPTPAPVVATPTAPGQALSTSVFADAPAAGTVEPSTQITATAAGTAAPAAPAGEAQATATPAAPAVAATAAPTLTPLPAASLEPQGAFADWWSGDPALQQALGLARIAQPVELPIAWQPFENGLMVWRSDELRIYALLEDGAWESYADTFVEGEPESDASLASPGNLLQPVRGFGKIWRDDRTLQQRIGWATDDEGPATAAIQYFENGFILRIGARSFAVYDAGDGNRWVERR